MTHFAGGAAIAAARTAQALTTPGGSRVAPDTAEGLAERMRESGDSPTPSEPSYDWPIGGTGGGRQGGGNLGMARGDQPQPALVEAVPDLKPRIQQCQCSRCVVQRAAGRKTPDLAAYQLPCPACGGAATWWPSQLSREMNAGTVWRIDCAACGPMAEEEVA